MKKFLLRGFIGILIVVCVIIGIAAAFYFLSVTTIQEKTNPDASHRAKLVRHSGIDINFKVIVDGEQVYWSSDFAPVRKDFREQLVWDATGNIVVLEVAGQRLFGYDAKQKRKLTDDELLAVEYIPFTEYGYEGKLPVKSR